VPLRVALRVTLDDRHGQTTLGSAVVFTHDDVLRHVHQTSGQVTRVGGTQRGVGQALTGTVRCDEVLENRQALAVVRLDRTRDDLTLRVRHQATHSGDLTHLHPVTTSTGADHRLHRVVLREGLAHLDVDLVGRTRPDLDELLTALRVGDQTGFVLVLHLRGERLVAIEDLLLVGRSGHVGNGNRDARTGRPVEAGRLQSVERCRDLNLLVALRQSVDDVGKNLLVDVAVHVRERDRKQSVEDRATESGLEAHRLTLRPAIGSNPAGRRHSVAVDAESDRRAEVDDAGVESHEALRLGTECESLALRAFLEQR